eukprot:6168065-Amphidinium_carterae.1
MAVLYSCAHSFFRQRGRSCVGQSQGPYPVHSHSVLPCKIVSISLCDVPRLSRSVGKGALKRVVLSIARFVLLARTCDVLLTYKFRPTSHVQGLY